MCTSDEIYCEPLEIKQKYPKKCVPRYFHLFKEKVYHISKKNSHVLTTGYRPDESGRFKFFLRLDDYRYGDFLNLTLFQFVNLMRDLRNIIYDIEDIEILDKVDAAIQFPFKEINVPKVTVEVDNTCNVPNIFQLKLTGKDKQISCIVLERKTLQRVIESEAEIINTIEALEDRPSNYLLDLFITKCVDHLSNEKTEIHEKKIFVELKSLDKTPFQSEIFLKFWPLVYKLIENKLKKNDDTKCEP